MSGPAGLLHDLAALLGVHLAPFDADIGDTRVDADAALDVFLDLGAKWAAADRQLDGDHDPTVGIDAHVGNHAECHDVRTQFGVDDGREKTEHLIGGRSSSGNHEVNATVIRGYTARRTPIVVSQPDRSCQEDCS